MIPKGRGQRGQFRPWALLGHCWALLGRVWALLGPSWRYKTWVNSPDLLACQTLSSTPPFHLRFSLVPWILYPLAGPGPPELTGPQQPQCRPDPFWASPGPPWSPSRLLREPSRPLVSLLWRFMCAPGRPQVALERFWVTLGMLWATLGRLLIDFWSLLVPKSSSKGGLGGF